MNPRTNKPVQRDRVVEVPAELAAVLHVEKREQIHFWIEAPLGDAWVAAYRLMMRDDRPLIVELRVFPAEGAIGDYAGPPGEWSGAWIARPAVPGNGITAGLLRKQIQPAVVLKHMKDIRARIQKQGEEYWAERGVPSPPRDRRGRKPKPDAFYAEVARDYVAALKAGSKQPAADLSRARGISRVSGRALVRQARLKGFLTRDVLGGYAGGELTKQAERALLPPQKRRKVSPKRRKPR